LDAKADMFAFDLAGVLEQLANPVLLIGPEGLPLRPVDDAGETRQAPGAAGAHVELDMELERPDGAVRVALGARPLRNREGHLVGTLVVLDDAGERRAGRERVDDDARQARRLESVGRLAGGIAHEFNNLLRIIGGFSKRLLDRAPDEATRRELLAIDDATGRAVTLVRQLLAFGGRQLLQARPAAVAALLRTAEQEQTA
jgi:two-component system, cell cycle sensor histidine kinase and response regulator CckA